MARNGSLAMRIAATGRSCQASREVPFRLSQHMTPKSIIERIADSEDSHILQNNVHRAASLGTKNPFLEKFGRKPRLLDLFCCAGGASTGYAEAGFDVVGVDTKRQPNYPYQFIEHDAMKLASDFIRSFDVIHASPPCQSYSDLAKRNRNADSWPRLIEPVREMLVGSGLCYVIENVEGAPLLSPVMLCGTMFKGLRVLRHRLFEANFPILTPKHGKHPRVHTFDKRKSHYGKTDDMRDFVQVTGGGNCTIAAARDAMGISWMNKGELNEAIPPAYTRLIGKQLVSYIAITAQPKGELQRSA